MNTDKLMLKPCMYHRRVSKPDNELIEPSDSIIVRKTVNNETNDYIRQSTRLTYNIYASLQLRIVLGACKSLACNEYSLLLKCFIGWRRHQAIIDTESHLTILFPIVFSASVMCF